MKLGCYVCLIVLEVGILGCDKATERRPVGGAVTVDGHAVARGSVSFFPDRGQSGPPASTAITAGRYQFNSTNGPTAGPHRVVIGIETNPAGIKVNIPAISNGAKQAPRRPAPKPSLKTEPAAGYAGPTQWTSTAEIAAASSSDRDQVIDFAFQTNLP